MPLVSDVIPAGAIVIADPIVTVAVVAAAIVNAVIVLPAPNTVVEVGLFKLIVNAVYVPPLDKVKMFKFSVVVANVKAVVPKFKLLNQLLLVNVATEVPLPVNVTLGAFALVPPAVLPKVYVLTTEASAVNPPVPV